MKKCANCQQIKEISSFNKCSSKKDGHSSYCRICDNAKSKTYHKGYASKRREINKKRAESNQIQIIQYLKSHPCVDCGYNNSPSALAFDHISGNKKHNVSKMIRDGYSWVSILEEIEKCEVRCANCHLEKTSKDFNWFSQTW